MSKTRFLRKILTVGCLISAVAMAYDGKPAPQVSDVKPAELKDVGIDEKLGTQVDLNLKFKNEKGELVPLSSFYNGHQPVILSLVYYSCPGLCNFHLNGLTDGLKGLDWNAGDKFQVVAISFDPKEDPALATSKKESYMDVYKRPGTENGWHFLTGDEETIRKLTNSVGFKYKWVESEKEWSHASAAIVTTNKGIISRYLPGIFFEAKDIKLALNEASSGKIGTFIDSLILYCFQYNPHQSKYTLYAFNVMKLGAAIMVLFLGLWLIPIWRRNLRRKEMVRG